MSAHTAGRRWLGLLALPLALAGCGTPAPPVAPPSPPAPAAAPATTAPPTAAAAPTTSRANTKPVTEDIRVAGQGSGILARGHMGVVIPRSTGPGTEGTGVFLAAAVEPAFEVKLTAPAQGRVGPKSYAVQREREPAAGAAVAAVAAIVDAGGGGLSATAQTLVLDRYTLSGDPAGAQCTTKLSDQPVRAEVVNLVLHGDIAMATVRSEQGVRRIAVSGSCAVAWSADVPATNRDAAHIQQVAITPSGRFVVGGTGALEAYDVATGSRLGSFPMGPDDYVTVHAVQGNVMVWQGDFPGKESYGFFLFDLDKLAFITTEPASSYALDPVRQRAVLTFKAGDDAPDTALVLRTIDLTTGSDVFTLTKKAASGLGDLVMVGAYDGHAIVEVADGLRVVMSDTGAPAPGWSESRPGHFRSTATPLLGDTQWVLLGVTNGFGEHLPEFGYTTIVRAGRTLAWEDLPGMTLAPR